jgi:peptidoglycan/LPS O-acetylase OafA/YrhL
LNTTLLSEQVKTRSAPLAKTYYPVLTGLRALAAYMVFLSHDNIFVNHAVPAQPGSVQSLLAQFTGYLSIGVSVFFVLSGFLITLRYQDSVQLNWQWAQRYLRNRVARIYPVYFLVTVLTWLAISINIRYDPSRLWHIYTLKDKIAAVVLNLTFLRGFFENFRFSLAGQGWSLTVEECFYLSAPLLILGLRSRPWRLVSYPIILLGIGLGLVALCAPFHGHLYGLFASVKFMLNWTFFGRCIEFIMGMGLAMYVRQHPDKKLNGVLFTASGFTWMMLCAAAMAYLERNSGPAAAWNMQTYSAFFVSNLILPIGVVSFFVGLLYEKTLLRQLLETPLLDLLGKSSYSFYLIHVGVLDFLIDDNITTNILAKFIIINIVAIAIYKLVEHPLHARLVSKRSSNV